MLRRNAEMLKSGMFTGYPDLATISEIEAVFNTPSVRPAFFPTEGYVDFSKARQYPDGDNIHLIYDGAVCMFIAQGDQAYDIHLCLPSYCRGLRGLVAVAKMIHQMFAFWGADVIYGNPLRDNRAVRLFGTRLGFINTGRTINTHEGEHCVYELRSEVWDLQLLLELEHKLSEALSLRGRVKNKPLKQEKQLSLPLSR